MNNVINLKVGLLVSITTTEYLKEVFFEESVVGYINNDFFHNYCANCDYPMFNLGEKIAKLNDGLYVCSVRDYDYEKDCIISNKKRVRKNDQVVGRVIDFNDIF